MLRDSAFLSRRILLAGLGAGAVGAVAATAPVLSFGSGGAGPGAKASRWDRAFLSLQSAGLDEWSKAVGETFALRSVNGAHRVRLVAVTAFPRSGARPAKLARAQAFSVVFEAAGGPPLPAGDSLYQLVHASYPSLPIHMAAPVGLGRTTRLTAVFN